MALYTVPIKTQLTASSNKTLILVNPITVSIKIRQIDVSLDNAAATPGVQFDIVRCAVGGGVSTPFVPIKVDERDGAATSTVATIYTTEPTAVPAIIASYYVQPLGGLLPLPFPYGSEIIAAKTGFGIGLRYTTAASVTPDVVAQIWFEEG